MQSAFFFIVIIYFWKFFFWKLKFSFGIQVKQQYCLLGSVGLSDYSWYHILHNWGQIWFWFFTVPFLEERWSIPLPMKAYTLTWYCRVVSPYLSCKDSLLLFCSTRLIYKNRILFATMVAKEENRRFVTGSDWGEFLKKRISPSYQLLQAWPAALLIGTFGSAVIALLLIVRSCSLWYPFVISRLAVQLAASWSLVALYIAN